MKDLIFDPNKKRYCGICGAYLLVETYAKYYDGETGEDYYHYRFTCPRYRWWRFWDYHTHFKCDENGSTYSYEA